MVFEGNRITFHKSYQEKWVVQLSIGLDCSKLVLLKDMFVFSQDCWIGFSWIWTVLVRITGSFKVILD